MNKLNQLTSFSFDSGVSGPRILILGAVHGNEICGPLGIQKFINELKRGDIKLQSGSLTLIPVVNQKAYDENKRYIDENLNRNLSPRTHPQNYEQSLMTDLCGFLESCDVLLDIHSASETTLPYAFINATQRPHEMDYARHLGVRYAVTGWEDAYKRFGGYDETASMGTTEYARKFGATALTLECGGHRDPSAPYVAYESILRCLSFFGMIDRAFSLTSSFTALRLEDVFYKTRDGAHSKKWHSFEDVKSGHILAVYDDGEKIITAKDGVVLLPRPAANVGEEWIYIAQPL